MITLSILTGFLGSGKTTLLNRLLRDPDMATTAVLVNELGDVGIDNLIVDRVDEDIVLLESGCVCCSVRDDLTSSLLALSARAERHEIPAFDHAVLETTGIADPGAILQLLMGDELICSHYRPGNVVTVVDACYALQNFDEIPEVTQQVLLADKLVLSKTDLVDGDRLRILRARLEGLNSMSPVYYSSDVSPADLFRTALELKPRKPIDVLRHANRYATFHIGWQEAVSWPAIETWIEGLLSARGQDLFRIKGIMNIKGEECPVVFQAVQHSVYKPSHLQSWPGGAPRTDLVFIAKNFTEEAALNSLKPFIDVAMDA